jgi:subtilase family serine protease
MFVIIERVFAAGRESRFSVAINVRPSISTDEPALNSGWRERRYGHFASFFSNSKTSENDKLIAPNILIH